MTSSMIVDQGILRIPHTVTFGRVGHHHWSPLNRAFREEQYQFERHKTPSKQQVWRKAGMLVQNYRKYRPSTPPDCKNSNILQDTDLMNTCQSFVSTNQKKLSCRHTAHLFPLPCKHANFSFSISTSRHMATNKISLDCLKTKSTLKNKQTKPTQILKKA